MCYQVFTCLSGARRDTISAGLACPPTTRNSLSAALSSTLCFEVPDVGFGPIITVEESRQCDPRVCPDQIRGLRARVRDPHESMVWSANSPPSSTHTLTLLELDGGLAHQGHDRCRWVETSWRLFLSQLSRCIWDTSPLYGVLRRF